MNSQLFGLILSVILIFSVLALVGILKKTTKISNEILRKIVHIAVSNWWFILIIYIKDPLYAALCPIAFIFFNLLFVFYPKLAGLFGFDNKRQNYGLVYYPFSLLIIVILCYNNFIPLYAGTLGVMCMGYGDGLAAVFGSKFGKKKITINNNKRTYVGSITMFVVCFLITFIVLSYYFSLPIFTVISKSLVIAMVATLVEVVTPFGLDNLSVPLIVTLAGGLI